MTVRHVGVIDLVPRFTAIPSAGSIDLELPADAEVLGLLAREASPTGAPALVFTASSGTDTSLWRATFVEVGGALPTRFGRFSGVVVPPDPSKLPVALFLDRLAHG